MIPTDKQYLVIEPGLDYEFIFENYELAFPVEQLNRITMFWNNGWEVEEIAKKERRDPIEIFLALIHQAIKKKIKRPYAWRF